MKTHIKELKGTYFAGSIEMKIFYLKNKIFGYFVFLY